MREIKFRAWDKEDKKMIRQGGSYSTMDMQYPIGFQVPNHNKIILMQYIGLKDKNGKMIFEDDFVKVKLKDKADNPLAYNWHFIKKKYDYYKVFFDEDYCIYCLYPYINNERASHVDFPFLLGSWILEIEIIGNMHENSELLKGDKNENN
jgi:uncharacterized phage protein (TIGR01671 family)